MRGLLVRLRTFLVRDEHTGVLIRGSTASLVLNSASQLLSFGLHVLVARLLGVAEYGVFAYAMAWLSVALIPGKLGFDTAVVRFVPAYVTQADWAAVSGIVRFGRWAPTLFSVLIALIGALACFVLLRAQEHDSTLRTLQVMWLLLPVAVHSELSSAALRSLKAVTTALSGDLILRPLLAGVMATVIFTLQGQLHADEFMLVYGIATLGVAFLVTHWLRSRLPPDARAVPPRWEQRLWLRTALLLMLANGFLLLMYAVDTLIIGLIQGPLPAGQYSVASRVALVGLFVMNAAQVIAGPLIAECFAAGNREALQRIVTVMVWCSSATALLFLGLIVVVGKPLLGVFGPEFVDGYLPLLVLAVMQLVNVATGPVGLLLSLCGEQRRLIGFLFMGLLVNVALDLVLIPRIGILGAAVSSLVAHTLWNVCAALVVWRRLGIVCTAVARVPQLNESRA